MFLDPKEILHHLPLTASSRVGDFGAGAGHYSFAVADRLGAEGVLYAFDAFTPALDRLRREGARYAPEFHALHADFNQHIPIRDDLLQGAVVANVLHQVHERERFVNELARVIAPGGNALVIDWVSSFQNMGPPPESILSSGEVVRLFRSAGFATGEMLPAGAHHFAFLATMRGT